MAFRDNLGAVQERAEALERENEQLRARLASASQGAPSRRSPQRRFRILSGTVLLLIFWAAVWLGISAVHYGAPARIVVPAVVALLSLLVIGVVLVRVVVIAGPHEALVIYGAQSRSTAGRVGARIVVDSRPVVALPVVQQVLRFSLEPWTVPLDVSGKCESGAPARLTGEALLRIPRDPETIWKVVEHFGGKSRDAIVDAARMTLDAGVRAALPSTRPEDPAYTEEALRRRCCADLERVGVQLERLNVEVRLVPQV